MSNVDGTSEQLAEQKHQARAKRRYVKLSLGRTHCITHPAEAAGMLIEDADLISTDVWLTQAEFEALPEFQGF